VPATEIHSFTTGYTTTSNAVPKPLCEHCASLNVGEAVWISVRVKAASPTRSWYAEYIFFARRATAASPVIYSKMLLSYEPEGKVNWELEMVPVGLDAVVVRVIGQAGSIIDWAVSTRGYKKFPL